MKVSKRIAELRKLVDDLDIGVMSADVKWSIIQLEAEIVEALQVARQDGYDEGRWIGERIQ